MIKSCPLPPSYYAKFIKKDLPRISFKEFRAKYKHRMKKSEEFARKLNLFKENENE